MIVAGQSSSSSPKSSNRIWLSRLRIKTARRMLFRRSVSRLVRASYANYEAQLSQFKRATLFETRRKAISRTHCHVKSCGVQFPSPLSRFATWVRIRTVELLPRYTPAKPKPSIPKRSAVEGFVVRIHVRSPRDWSPVWKLT